MTVFDKVTLESLKKNSARTIVTIVGIILSTSMICAVTAFASSFQKYLYESTAYIDGSWEGVKSAAPFEAFEDIKNSPKVRQATYVQRLGYAVAQGCANEFKPYLYLLGGDKGAKDLLPFHLVAGKFPASPSEILLPGHLASNGGLKYKIGDAITLNLGERILDGEALWQDRPAYAVEQSPSGETKEVLTDEKILVRESRTYQVVGFYERFPLSLESRTAPGYTAFTAADHEPSRNYLYDVYYRMKNPKEVYDFAKDKGVSFDFNDNVLRNEGVSVFAGFGKALSALLAIVIALIMAGSVSLIYNAFSISVSERTKQFGLLSSVGATKKQLQSMVLREAFIVSAVGIPIGILAGIGGIGVTLILIGKKFRSILQTPIDLTLSVSYVSIVIALSVSLVTVLVSAWIPSKRATKISGIEAIRQNRDICSTAKPIRTSKLTYQLFGVPGLLADKYYKRSRKKYRTTVFSLFMSIVLFISAAAFSQYLTNSLERTFDTIGYDLDLSIGASDMEASAETADELLGAIKEAKSVTDAAYTKEMSFPCKIDKSYLTAEAASQALASFAPFDEGKEGSTLPIDVCIDFVDDETFLSLIQSYGLSKEKYMDAENPLALAVDGVRLYDPARERFKTLNYLKADGGQLEAKILKAVKGYCFNKVTEDEKGNKVVRYGKEGSTQGEEEEYFDLSEKEAYIQKKINFGKIIYDRPFFLDTPHSLELIYPMSVSKPILQGGELYNYGYEYQFRIASDNHTQSYHAVKSILADGYCFGYSLIDLGEDEEAERNIVTVLNVFSYGFIILISLIAAANVFNTISTNISLRRRQFAMLKSMGMTSKGFRRMMNFECLLYGSRALIFGLPASFCVTFLIRQAIAQGYETRFLIPWKAVGIAIFSVFAVVFAAMMYSMSKVKKENIIETLRNENL